MNPSFLKLALGLLLSSALFTVGCSAQQSEEQALRSLRELTKDAKLPPEDVVSNMESRYAGRKTGALAKLLHARIRFENNDFTSAASILNSDVFRKKTSVGDYALWLRGRALQRVGNHAEAMTVLASLIKDFPDSIRVHDAKLLWATSATASGHVSDVSGFLSDLNEKNDPEALLLTARAYETQGSPTDAIKYYRRIYFFAAGTPSAKEAEARLTLSAQPLAPQTGEEELARADKLFASKNYSDAAAAYNDLAIKFPL